MIKLSNICKKFNNTNVLTDVSINLPDNGLVCIVGKSGSGKTTLLNILSGSIPFDSGEYLIDDLDTKKFDNNNWSNIRANYFGYIFQNYNLLESNTVYENIKLVTLNLTYEVNDFEIDQVLERLDIINLKNKLVNELSGGEKQRVAIARSIIKRSKVILADEPTGALDYENGTNVFEILKEISKERLVIIVTHDTDFSNQYADYIIKLSYGKIVESNLKCDYAINKTDTLKQKKFSFKQMLELKEIIIKKNLFKNIFSIILYSLIAMILCITLHISLFNQNKYTYNVIMDEKIEYNYISESPNSLDGMTYSYISNIDMKDYDCDLVYLNQFNLTFLQLFGINFSKSFFEVIIVDDTLSDNEIGLSDYYLDKLKEINCIEFNNYNECLNKTLNVLEIEMLIKDINITNYRNYTNNSLYSNTNSNLRINGNTLKKLVNYTSVYFDGDFDHQRENMIKYYSEGSVVGQKDLSSNEIAVSSAVIWKFFEGSFNEFQTNRDDACKKYLGKTIIINGNEFIINAITTEEGLKITYSKEYFDSLFDYSEINLSDYQHLYKINITNYNDFNNLMKMLDANNLYLINHHIMNINSVIELMDGGFKYIFIAFGIILLVILLVFILFSNRVYVKNNKRNIGILKMLGYEKKNIYNCYNYSNLVMIAIALIIGGILSFTCIALLNSCMISNLSIDAIKPNILIYILVSLFLYSISVLTLSLMLKSLSKYNIINLINKE